MYKPREFYFKVFEWKEVEPEVEEPDDEPEVDEPDDFDPIDGDGLLDPNLDLE